MMRIRRAQAKVVVDVKKRVNDAREVGERLGTGDLRCLDEFPVLYATDKIFRYPTDPDALPIGQ